MDQNLITPLASRNFLLGTGTEMGGELARYDALIGQLKSQKADPALVELVTLTRADHFRLMNAMLMIGSTKLQADPPTNPPSPPQPTLRQRFARWLLGV